MLENRIEVSTVSGINKIDQLEITLALQMQLMDEIIDVLDDMKKEIDNKLNKPVIVTKYRGVCGECREPFPDATVEDVCCNRPLFLFEKEKE